MDLSLPSESTDIPESSTSQSVSSDDDKNSISDIEYLKSNPALKTVVNFVGIKTALTSGRDIRKPSRLLAYLMLSVESAVDDIRNSTVYRTDLAHATEPLILSHHLNPLSSDKSNGTNTSFNSAVIFVLNFTSGNASISSNLIVPNNTGNECDEDST